LGRFWSYTVLCFEDVGRGRREVERGVKGRGIGGRDKEIVGG